MRALYAGSFDPITLGHFDVINRVLPHLEHLVVAVSTNPAKKTMFTGNERVHMIIEALFEAVPEHLHRRITVISVGNGLTVEVAQSQRCSVLIRGLRPHGDFESEYNLAAINKSLEPAVETMFVIASPELATVSSSAVKSLASYQKPITRYVTANVEGEVKKRIFNTVVS